MCFKVRPVRMHTKKQKATKFAYKVVYRLYPFSEPQEYRPLYKQTQLRYRVGDTLVASPGPRTRKDCGVLKSVHGQYVCLTLEDAHKVRLEYGGEGVIFKVAVSGLRRVSIDGKRATYNSVTLLEEVKQS